MPEERIQPRVMKLSRWVLREPLDDLSVYPLPETVRSAFRGLLTPAGVRCYLFNALRRSRNFHAQPFTEGVFVDEPRLRLLNDVLQDPVEAARTAPPDLAAELLSLGILTYSDADDEDSHWKALEAGLPEQPKISWIEITNRCEMTCSFCDRSEMKRRVADMSRDRLRLGLEQCRESGQKVVQLYGLGEPLLHPDLPEFVRMAADAGLAPAFSCVPVYLTPELTEALLDAGLRAIVFSIDSLDPEVFRRVRGVKADLASCLRNIDHFLARNAERGKPVQATARMISLNANDADRERFMAYWLARDVDIAYVRPFGIHGHHVERKRARLQEFKGDWTSLKLCTWPWVSSVATVDGSLHACCMRSSGPMVMGSWTDTPSKETWRNQAYEELRRALKAGDFEPDHPCATCIHAFHNVKAQLARVHEHLTSVDDLPAVGWEF